MKPFILVIGGSDSSGGAGIQADIRALQYAGAPAAFAVTAITAQGIDGVTAIQLTEPSVLREQIDQAFKTYEIRAVKIGMLGSAAQVHVVVEMLRHYAAATVVLDTVLASTSGTSLLDAEGRAILIKELLPLCAVVMPNVPELAILTGMPVETEDQRMEAAKKIVQLGAGAVVVKGGHLEVPDDILVESNGEISHWGCDGVRLRESRGTGCMLASFMAANLARRGRLQGAMKSSKAKLQWALEEAYLRSENEPGLLLVGSDSVRDGRNPPDISGIYFVSDGRLNPKFPLATGARLARQGGARVIQLRDKHLPLNELIKVGRRMTQFAHQDGAIMIVNDRVDVALAVGADGVHLGPDDMDPESARQILGWRKIIGASVSSVEEANPLAQWVDYIAVGAIFGSSTKDDAGAPVGVERITEIKRAFPDKKIVAIGGINLSNIASVAAAGADAAAVVSAVVCAPDPEQATRELLAEFERGNYLRANSSISLR